MLNDEGSEIFSLIFFLTFWKRKEFTLFYSNSESKHSCYEKMFKNYQNCYNVYNLIWYFSKSCIFILKKSDNIQDYNKVYFNYLWEFMVGSQVWFSCIVTCSLGWRCRLRTSLLASVFTGISFSEFLCKSVFPLKKINLISLSRRIALTELCRKNIIKNIWIKEIQMHSPFCLRVHGQEIWKVPENINKIDSK